MADASALAAWEYEMIVTRKDAERIIRANVPMSAADRIRIPSNGCQCFISGVQPISDVAGVAARKLAPGRVSAVQLGRLYRTGLIDWSASF